MRLPITLAPVRSNVSRTMSFDAGEQMWPEESPFHTPVFVVTHEKRDPWELPGGTTFHFVNDGIESELDQAREAPAIATSASRAVARRSWST